MNKKPTLVIRVYALIINSENEILITDEFQLNTKMTKFPGGGLEPGEGLKDCIIREIKEECNGQVIKNIRHFYTTDFYQKALFYKNAQLISVYYLADLCKPIQFNISEKPFDFERLENGNQSFRWIKPAHLNTSDLSFPIDQIVLQKLKKQFH